MHILNSYLESSNHLPTNLLLASLTSLGIVINGNCYLLPLNICSHCDLVMIEIIIDPLLEIIQQRIHSSDLLEALGLYFVLDQLKSCLTTTNKINF
jgi:hypothetical protein